MTGIHDRWRTGLTAVLFGLLLAGCVGLTQHEPVRVSVADIDPMPGEGLEARFLVKLRIQNPNETPIRYNGIYAELKLNGRDFGSGVVDRQGEVPRFGEAIVAVPMVVPFTALVGQLFDLTERKEPIGRIEYRLRGRLGGMRLGGISFEKRGELSMDATEHF